MSEARTESKANGAAPKIRRVFGLDGDALLDRLEKKRVRLVTSTGDEIVGVLVGATPYTVTLLVGDDKVPTIVNKGHMITLQPVVNGSKGIE